MAKKTQNKNLKDLLNESSLDDSFVIGYYGGGNYGDELLFEVLQHVFEAREYKQINFLYQKPVAYERFHTDLGYEPVDARRKWNVIQTIMKRKNLVVGGGGLWGLDVNFNIVLTSFMLFAARWFLGKEVYLIGVGYYNSTTQMGHFAAWLAGKSATQILARDDETYKNFARLNPQTYLSDDMAWMLPEIDTGNSNALAAFEETVCKLDNPTIMISIRHFKPHQKNTYTEAAEEWLMENPDIRVILALMEPREVDPDGFALLKGWQRKRGNAVVIDFDYNPTVLYEFFKRHRRVLSYVGPQFHVQLVAHLAGVRLFPVVYDNKVSQLLTKLGYDNLVHIQQVTADDIEGFVDSGKERQ